MNIKNAFGNRVKQLRKSLGETQANFAEKADIGTDALSMIERGENWPHYNTLENIASAFDMPISDLLDGLNSADPNKNASELAQARAILARLPAEQLSLVLNILKTFDTFESKDLDG